jgi:hypothetical protein
MGTARKALCTTLQLSLCLPGPQFGVCVVVVSSLEGFLGSSESLGNAVPLMFGGFVLGARLEAK